MLRVFRLYHEGLLINSSEGIENIDIACVHYPYFVYVDPLLNAFVYLSVWLTGFLLAEVLLHVHTSHLCFHHFVFWSLLLVSGVVLTYTGITFLGLDPFWSLDLDKKWCAKSEWVHPDTTPFFSFCDNVSSLKQY